jgi:hypothetical protein
MKAAKNTDLVQKASTPPAILAGDMSNFFDENVVTDSKDIVIPRILLMHGTSTLVGQQKAVQGDIVDSVSAEVLAKLGKPVEIIPIKQLDKEWNVEKWVQMGKAGKFEFERSDPWDESLKNELEFTKNGERYRRNARLSFYVLLARDATSNHLPYLIAFQRTSYTAGRNIASFFSEAKFAFQKGDKKSIPMSQVFELGCGIKQGDLGPYYVLEAKRSRLSNAEELEKSIYWFSQLRTKSYKVHEEKTEVETPEGTREF